MSLDNFNPNSPPVPSPEELHQNKKHEKLYNGILKFILIFLMLCGTVLLVLACVR